MGLYIVQIEKFNGNKEKKLSLQRKKKSQRIHTRTIGLFPSRGPKQKKFFGQYWRMPLYKIKRRYSTNNIPFVIHFATNYREYNPLRAQKGSHIWLPPKRIWLHCMYKPSLFQEIRRDRKKEYVDKKKGIYASRKKTRNHTRTSHYIYSQSYTFFTPLILLFTK